MRRLLLVANPAASGFTGSAHHDVVAILSEAYEVTTVWPNGPEDARETAARAASEGVDVVAAMGGDGVAHRVANGIAGTATALAVIPAGTTNVLAGVLGLPAGARRAAQRVVSGRVVPLATLRVVADRRGTLRRDIALFSAGVGLDADIVALAEQDPIRKVGFGPLHYARSALSVVVKRYGGARPTIRVTAPGRTGDAVGVFVQIHDRYTEVAGRAMRLTMDRHAGLSALVIGEVSPSIAARVLGRGITGRDLRRVPGIDVWAGVARLTITAEPAARFQADGELLGRADRVEIDPSPEELRVVAASA